MRIYVNWFLSASGIEFTTDKTKATDFVDKSLSAPALKLAKALNPDYAWKLVPFEQTGGVFFFIMGTS